MATKIQLRRDLAANWEGTNPVLAQGEPGVELDTKKMKVGDGVTAWNSLEYVATDAGENTQQNMFVKFNALNNDNWYKWSGVVSVSTDGLNWTPGTFNMQSTNANGFDVRGFAVGGGRIVYHGMEDSLNIDEDYYSLRWAYNPFDKPNLPLSDAGDITRRGPNGESITWHNVRYVGGIFVAVGSYYDSVRNDYDYPYALYSTDGDAWTKIDFDLAYLNGKILDQINNDATVSGIEAQDVTYGDGGWLIGLHWGMGDGSTTNRRPAGSMFTTAFNTTLGSATYVSSIPGTYISAFDGHGWVAWTHYNTNTGGAAMYFNSSTDPRSGSWTMVDIGLAAQNLTGITSNGCISDVVAGVVNGENWIVIGLTNQGALATNDQGQTWRMIKTSSSQGQLVHVSNTNPMYIDNYSGSTPNNGEKVTILGSNISQLNGTFWARYYNGPAGYQTYFYHDEAHTSPLDATSWGNVNVTVSKTVTTKYKQHVVGVNNTTGLVVGMVADNSNFYPFDNSFDVADPNIIMSIDSVNNTITMKYPYPYSDDTFTVQFRPLLQRSETDGLTSIAYGDGAFVGFGYYSLSAYRTDDMMTWKRTSGAAHTQIGGEGYTSSTWGYNYTNSVFYGAVTTSNALIINNSETKPGFASFLSVGDNFNMTVVSGDPLYSEGTQQYFYGTSMINMDPTQGAWNISNSFGTEGYWDVQDGNNYTTSVETYSTEGYYDNTTNMYGGEGYGEGYLNNSVMIRSWNNGWRFDDYNGLMMSNGITSRYNSRDNGNGGAVYTNDTNVIVNGPHSGHGTSNGEGYAQVEWSGGINYLKVDWYGTQINTEGYHWNFSNDCNDNNYGVLYQPESTNIQTPGYWKIGDYFNDWENAYIQATNWAHAQPGDIKIHTGNTDGSHTFAFTRYGQLDMGVGGRIQCEGYWYMGDAEGYTSYTWIGATNNIAANAYDVLIAADDTYWYFNRDGNLQLPPGGDIVDSSYHSVLNKDMQQQLTGNSNYTLALSDRGGHVYVNYTGKTVYIPTNAAVAFPIGSVITLVTKSACPTTIASVDSETTTVILSKFGSDNSINISADTYVTILKIETDKWIIQT
jgi:Major tropism determinant N-terminal domain